MLFHRIRFALVSTAVLLLSSSSCFAIIAGTEAGDGEFPWIAGIIKKGNFTTTALIGGGALVDEQRVITAAHPFVGESAETIEVWIGMINLGATTIVKRDVLAIYRHPDFATSDGVSESDLAILVLDEPVYGIPVLPMLEDVENLQAGDSLEVVGFGTTDSEVLEPSSILYKASAEIITPTMGPHPYNLSPQDPELAAVDPDTTSTPCRGDSGGPLVKNIDGVDTLVGIVSYGSIDCDPAIPSVYSNVAFYTDWIQSALSLPIPTPNISISGKGLLITNGDGSPSKQDGTDFGRTRSKATRTFIVGNSGTSHLSISGVNKTSRRFSIQSNPTASVAAGSSTAFRIAFKPKKDGRRSKAWITITSSDPATPTYTFRISGRSKR